MKVGDLSTPFATKNNIDNHVLGSIDMAHKNARARKESLRIFWRKVDYVTKLDVRIAYMILYTIIQK